MLTVTFINEHTKDSHVVECVSVLVKRKNGSVDVTTEHEEKKTQSFVVAPKGNDMAGYHVAYVMNAQGATTQVVRA